MLKSVRYFILIFVLANVSCSSMPFSGGKFKLKPYKETTLSNGLRVLMIQDDSLPYFSMSMLLKTGYTSDPMAQPGLTAFVGQLLDKGTQSKTAMELADEFGQIGSAFSMSVSSDYSIMSTQSLSQYQEKLMDLFSEVISEQRFKKSEINRARRQVLAALKRSSDDPEGFAGKMFDLYLYGSHPYARTSLGTAKGVRSIGKKHVNKHYLKYFRPNNAILAVVGKLEPNIQEMLEKRFAKWKPREVVKPVFPKKPGIEDLKIRLVDKSDLVQAQIRMGHFGIKRSNPDYLKLRVANTILGRGFASRLMDKIRDNMGLTYSIGSHFDSRLDEGPFVIRTFTKNETVGKTISETLGVLKEFHKSGVTDDEVKVAKNYLLGVFPQAIDTPEKLAFNLLILRFYDIPDSYLTSYQQTISKITAAEVNDAVKKHIDPSKVKVLVFAKEKDVLSQVQPIGLVEKRSYREFF